PDMLLKLRPRIARLVFDRFRPEWNWTSLFDGARITLQTAIGELRHGAFRRNATIGRHDESASGDRQTALGPKKLQTVRRRLSPRRFSMRPDCCPVGVFEE